MKLRKGQRKQWLKRTVRTARRSRSIFDHLTKFHRELSGVCSKLFFYDNDGNQITWVMVGGDNINVHFVTEVIFYFFLRGLELWCIITGTV